MSRDAVAEGLGGGTGGGAVGVPDSNSRSNGVMPT